jgi:hypothetical protein
VPIDYSPTPPVAGQPRNTGDTEVERWTDYADTIGDVDTRLDAAETSIATLEGDTGLADHLGDTSDAHDASAVSFTPTGTIAATNVQDAIAEVASEGGGGGGATFSGAIVTNSGTVSIPSGAFTSLTFDTETSDTDSYHSTASNTDRLTIPTTGPYMITGGCIIPIGTPLHRYIEVYKNGTTRLALTSISAWNDAGFDAALSISHVDQFTAGDYVTIRVFQDTGSAKNASLIRASIVRLG